MNPKCVAQAAEVLLQARRGNVQAPDFAPNCRPATLDDGYAIQRKVARRLGEPIAAWKVGMTSEEAQRRRGLSHPITGRVFASSLYMSPATPVGQLPMLCIEGELAFRMARSLPPRLRPYTRQEVVDAIDTMYLAIEICGSRFNTWMETDAAGVVADNGFNAGLVLGPPIGDWQTRILKDITVRMLVDGDVVGQGSGAQVMAGDPILSVLFVANQQAVTGDGLLAGQVVTTGTLHGAPLVPPRAHCVADFGELGQVSLQYHG